MSLMINFSSQAQGLGQELITAYDGDLWKIDITNNTATQLTTFGYIYGPILSPDGLKIAYASAAPEAIASMEQGDYSSFIATNISVLDIATEQITVVADQADAGLDGGYMRSTPSWSPDSTKLLWTLLDYTPDSGRPTLQIYDLNTATTSTFAEANNVVGDADMVGFTPIAWGAGGIATITTRYVSGVTAINPAFYSSEYDYPNYDGMVDRLEIYNTDTGAITTYDFHFDPSGSSDNRFWGFEWVMYQGRSMIALQGSTRWELLDPLDGSRRPLDFPPRLRNESAANSLELFTVIDENNPFEIEWQVTDGQSTYATGSGWYMPAISSDGTMLAWPGDDGLRIWQDGDMQTIQIPSNTPANDGDYLKPVGGSSIAWGPSEWFVDDIISADCPNSPPTRLASAFNAMVLPGDLNNVRSDVGEAVIGQIPAGDSMQIIGVSKCDEQGIRYYPISFYDEESDSSIDGWTAEGLGDDYWLEPAMVG